MRSSWEISLRCFAPNHNLYAVKVLNRLGSGWLSDIIAGMEWAVNNDMDVISMSLGTSTYSAIFEEACNATYNAGLVIVAAAGNEGDGNLSTTETSYPAAFDSVIAVGATDENDSVAYFSNTGPYLELAAPGVNIYSTLPTYRVTLSNTYGYDYGTLSGTSMACPHVAGVAALIIAANPGISNVEVRQILQQTADDIDENGWDPAYGYGLVDADEAAGNDTLLPIISDLTPADGAYVNTSNVTISAKLSDPSGINGTSIVMLLDGSSVIPDFNSTTGVVSYYAELLSDGLHSVYLEASDTAGNTTNASWSFTVDTIPPEKVTKVTVTTVSSSQLNVTWTAVSDAEYYNIYRSSDNVSFALIASTTQNSYLDTGLAANTTYYYYVTAVDNAGNEGESSDVAWGTTAELPKMHVASIDMSLLIRGANYYALATVTIVDEDNYPVEGAMVYGHWENATTDSEVGLTDADGKITFISDRVRKPLPGTNFTFVVDDVVKNGWYYDESANVETRDSITV
ncbi:Subtilisin [Archaeoglobus veneficus SNP6]|uniref:Subtilisin n=1 Tax=Archaeoglobus veneficus (strain DSM 11195 / SNP6) TaxID=693661 RepID=F2KSD8_ARCVS|nr:Subtilisin [Archaeoglobus veneficus SNP6]